MRFTALKKVGQKGKFGQQEVTIRGGGSGEKAAPFGAGYKQLCWFLSGRCVIQVTITPGTAPGATLINWL